MERGGLGKESRDFSLGYLGFRRRGLGESLEQCDSCRYVLSRTSELWGPLIIGEDVLVDIAGSGPSASARAAAGQLVVYLFLLVLKLAPGFF